MFKMQKETSTISGEVYSVSEVISIERNNKKPINKRTIGVKTEDQQLVFFESRINLKQHLPEGTKVVVDYYFAGSIKGERSYNNIIAENIWVQ